MDSDKILSKIEARYKVMKNQNSDEDYTIWYHEEDVKKAIDLALTLNGVGCSLPTKEEMEVELKTLEQIKKTSKLNICNKSMRLGFNYCYDVIRQIENQK